MTNRAAKHIYRIAGLLSTGYFIALKIADLAFSLSFTDIWLALGIVLFLVAFRISKLPAEKKYIPFRKLPLWLRIIIAVIFCGILGVAGVCLYFICTPEIAEKPEETKYIIVLGGGTKHNETLGPTARRRIAKAEEFLKAYPAAKVIVSGGQGKYSSCPEAPVLAISLVVDGINKKRIVQEDKAKDTIQNFSYSAALIAAAEKKSLSDVLNEPVTVVTSRYHLARAERLAKMMGFTHVNGIASSTPPLYMLNSYCREICSYIKLQIRIWFFKKPNIIIE